MTEIKSAMDTGVYDNQPSHESKDVAGFGSPPATTCVEKYHPQSVGDIPDTKELYATNNPFLQKGPKAFRASSSKDCWLPFEIVEEIISRAPIESVIRCKPTSKQCYALCNDKRFIYNHLNLSQERFMRIYSDNVEIINPATLDILSLPVPAEFNCVPCTRLLSVIHCNGLLLCKWITATGLRNVNVAVWNPVLGQVKFVDTSSHSALNIYGFGYDDKDSYKILRISVRPNEFEIYDFKSKLWRAFSATMDWYLYTPDLKVSMNGTMYWLATTKGARIRETFIQSFDFSKETFKPICLVPFEWSRIDDAEAFSAFRGDRLSLFRQLFGDKDETREIEVWVTNKVTDGVVTLSKYFNVARPDLPILNPHFMRVPTFFIHKTNSIMLWCDKVVGEGYACTSLYEIGRGEIKKQVETGQPFSGEDERNHFVISFVYVPSLVPVPE